MTKMGKSIKSKIRKRSKIAVITTRTNVMSPILIPMMLMPIKLMITPTLARTVLIT